MNHIKLFLILFLTAYFSSCCTKNCEKCPPPKRIDYSMSIELGEHKVVTFDSLNLKFDFATVYDSLVQVDLVINESCPSRFYLFKNKVYQEEQKSAETLWIENLEEARCFGKQEKYLVKAIDVSHHGAPPKIKKNGTINLYQCGNIDKTILINIELCKPIQGKKLLDL